MRGALLLIACASSIAAGQDSSFSELRVRGSLLRNPVVGRIADDWRPGTGVEAEIAANLGGAEIGLRLGRLAYAPTTGKPAYTGTLFTLGLTAPMLRRDRLSLHAGVRLTDYRMDFDDPAIVAGLRTEEEVIVAAVGRMALPVARQWSVFAEGSWGVLMLSTRTPMVVVNAGVERRLSSPGWLSGILR